MPEPNFHHKKLEIILACYSIQKETNDILKVIHSLSEHSELRNYVLNSKICRFKPYLETILTQIREIQA
jgi:hypothetical protein